MTRIITRGDDAGSCVSANLAIKECCEKGALRNISVMAVGPAFDHAVEQLKDIRGVDFGLHVTLNSEWDEPKWGPVSSPESVPSLVDTNGMFTQNPGILKDRGFQKDEVMAEIQAQLSLVRRAGFSISYIDEHMGVSWIGLRADLAEICRKEGLIQSANYHYLDVSSSDPDSIVALQAAISRENDGDFVCVFHPGIDAPDMQVMGHEGIEPGRIAKERDDDRRLLMDPKLINLPYAFIRYSEAVPYL